MVSEPAPAPAPALTLAPASAPARNTSKTNGNVSEGAGASSTQTARETPSSSSPPPQPAALPPKPASEPLPESIEDFDDFLNTSVKKYVDLSNEIGGSIKDQVLLPQIYVPAPNLTIILGFACTKSPRV